MGFIFDIIILVIIVLNVVRYLRKGLTGAVLDIAGFLVAVIFSWILSPVLGRTIGKSIAEMLPSGGSGFVYDLVVSGKAARMIAFVLIFLVMSIVVGIVKKLLKNIKIPVADKLDKILGAVIGLLLGLAWAYVLSVVICLILTVLSAIAPQIGSIAESMTVTRWFYGLGIFGL
ncbi:MAG: CvpA family protein [Clostridia bacterium]|nr:CvpA family protein [Clostridia bacterium]